MPRRSPGDNSLFKDSNGYWTGVVEIPSTDGKRRQRRVRSKDRNTAIAKLKKLRTDVDAGRIATTGSTTVEKWLLHWVETIVKPNRAPNTYRSYEQVIRLHINPHIGSKRLDRLTAQNVRDLYTLIESDRFTQLAHIVLNKSYKQAMKEGMVPRNPLEAVDPPGYTPGPRAAFSFEVAAHIVSTAYRWGESSGTRWATAFLLGERRGELLGLEWDRVDLDEGYIDLAWQLQRMRKGWTPPAGREARQCNGTLWWTRPKTKAGIRIIPIYHLPQLVEALESLKAQDGLNPHGLVFHHSDGRPISPEEHYDDWSDLLSLAEVPYVAPHAIRRTTTTLLRKAGVPQDVRMMITGHTSAEAHRVYVQLEHEDAAKALGNLAALMPVQR